jgi:hypothetical protein
MECVRIFAPVSATPLLPRASGLEESDSNGLLGLLSQVCQYVHDENEKMQDADKINGAVSEHEEYTTEWVVSVTEGQKIADEIAERLGFINEGPVILSQSREVDTNETAYKFILEEDGSTRKPMEFYANMTQQLTAEESVSFAERETVKVLCSSIEITALHRRKRQTPSTSLGFLALRWVGSTVNVSWDHPSVGPPTFGYRVVHAALIVHNGAMTATYITFPPLPSTARSKIVTKANRNNINIFLVNAVDESSVYSSTTLDGAVIPLTLTNIEVEILNCTCINVSWSPSPRYTYAVAVFDGRSIRHFNVGMVTSLVVCNLKHLQLHLVFVVAMSGNDYSTSYTTVLLESGTIFIITLGVTNVMQ